MSTDPRAALTALVAAFERHLEASAARRGEGDPVVLAAYRDLVDAFEDYDDSLLDAFDEVTPFEVFRGDDADDEDADDEDADDEEFDEPDDVEGGTYTGLDDADYDDDTDDDDTGSAVPAGGLQDAGRPGDQK
jgi:hypothetical protein